MVVVTVGVAAILGALAGGVGGGVGGYYLGKSDGESDSKSDGPLSSALAHGLQCPQVAAQDACNALGYCQWTGNACDVNPVSVDLLSALVPIAARPVVCMRQTSESSCTSIALCGWDKDHCTFVNEADASQSTPMELTTDMLNDGMLSGMKTYLKQATQNYQAKCGVDGACSQLTATEISQMLGFPLQLLGQDSPEQLAQMSSWAPMVVPPVQHMLPLLQHMQLEKSELHVDCAAIAGRTSGEGSSVSFLTSCTQGERERESCSNVSLFLDGLETLDDLSRCMHQFSPQLQTQAFEDSACTTKASDNSPLASFNPRFFLQAEVPGTPAQAKCLPLERLRHPA